MRQNVVRVDFDKPFSGGDSIIEAPSTEEGHAQPMQGILILRVHLDSFAVKADCFVELVVTESIHRLLKQVFLCHRQKYSNRWRRLKPAEIGVQFPYLV